VTQIDYHVHSTHSGDGRISIEEMCRLAVERGLTEIAFSDHLDNNPDDDCFGLFDAAAFCRDVDECRERFGDRLVILKGAEIGEPHLYPGEIERILDGEQFDFLTGGIHWVGNAVVSVDCQAGQTDWVALYHAYFDEVLKAVECANFDVLAHFDLVKRFGVKYLGPFSIEPYRERIEAILRAMIDRGIALEVNTSGYRQPCGEPFPALETLRLYREFGGELITIGSDAHRPEHLGFGLERGMELIREAGFEAITLFRDGKPSQSPIR
jgi:histidinol-phosphatase (PHP family)